MTKEQYELVQRAAVAIEARDEAHRRFKEAEAEVAEICKEYSKLMRIWGYTTNMMRRVVEETVVKAA